VLPLTRILEVLPLVVFGWMIIGATFLFTRKTGYHNPRGSGIGLSIWGTIAAMQVATAPPLWMSFIGAAGLLLALALYQWAAASIRGRTFSLAGDDDVPQFVHRTGPYAYIRNPFYASYLLAEVSTVVMRPSAWGVAVVVFAFIYTEWLARFEEGKFEKSPAAREYAQYKARTGRLMPRLSGKSG
jgi:protein-S-isoprenylcysteine O-methyltransferase Ste14